MSIIRRTIHRILPRSCFAVLCFFLGTAIPHAHAAATNPSDFKIETNKTVLENGLTVLVSEMPNSTMVSLYALVKAGSVTEGKLLGSGISHFLEHMLFKGTAKRAVGQIAREVQAMGGVINASTSHDYTIFTLTVPADHFDQALDIISDMLMNSSFDAKEIQKEREVVYGEMRLINDRPEQRLSDLVFKTVYLRHPYRLPIIGSTDPLAELTREDFLDYYHTYYIPNNIVFSVAGQVKQAQVLPKIEQAFAGFKRGRAVLRNLVDEPTQISVRRYEESYHTQLTRLSLDYAGVSMADEDLYALDVLAMILGQGESSRLYQDLFRTKRLVKSISAENYTPSDRGLFEVSCVLDYKNVDQVILEIKEELKQIAQRGIDREELARVKRQMISSFVTDQQNSGNVAYNLATHEAFMGDIDFAQHYLNAIEQLSVQDLQAAAKRYFRDDRLSIVVLRPEGEAAKSPSSREERPKGEIAKIVFDNGLRILLKEDHSLPLVSMNLVVNGGLRQEPAGLTGLSHLFSDVWIKGTRSLTAEQIAQKTEALGMSVGGFSGTNSFGISMEFLSLDKGDAKFAFDLLESLVKHPTFPEGEIAKEKEVMVAAIQERADSVAEQSSLAMKEMLFKKNPLRNDELGSIETVSAIRRDDLLAFYQQFVVPNNAVITVFGDINSSALAADLRKRFSGLVKKDLTLGTVAEAAPTQTVEKTISLDKEQAAVVIGFQGVDFYHPDRFKLDVLSAVIGSPFNGHMFTKIRDELGLAYTLGGGYTPAGDLGLISFYVLTSGDKKEDVKKQLVDIIQNLQNEKVSERELDEIKAFMLGGFERSRETISSFSFLAGLDELYGLGYDYYKSYEQRVKDVTVEDVQEMAKKYLDLNKAVIVVADPSLKMNRN